MATASQEAGVSREEVSPEIPVIASQAPKTATPESSVPSRISEPRPIPAEAVNDEEQFDGGFSRGIICS